MERVSEYYLQLSGDAKTRYCSKVVGAGLNIDPYAIPNESWLVQLDRVPEVKWSDMFTYMISTPSPYTREELKVAGYVTTN